MTTSACLERRTARSGEVVQIRTDWWDAQYSWVDPTPPSVPWSWAQVNKEQSGGAASKSQTLRAPTGTFAPTLIRGLRKLCMGAATTATLLPREKASRVTAVCVQTALPPALLPQRLLFGGPCSCVRLRHELKCTNSTKRPCARGNLKGGRRAFMRDRRL